MSMHLRSLRAITAIAATAAVTVALLSASPSQAVTSPDATAAAGSAAASSTGTWPTRVGSTVFKHEGETVPEAYARVRDTFGGALAAVRVFHSGLPASWARLTTNYGSTPLIVSFELNPANVVAGQYDSQLLAWFQAAPTTYPTRWTYLHEPEDNIQRGELTAEAYREAWRHIATLADSVGNPKLRATLILMCWTLSSNSGLHWQDYYAGDATIDLLGFDCYNAGHRRDRYRSPEGLLSNAAQVSAQTGKGWGIAELGSIIVDGDDGTGRAAWLRACVQYARDHGARFVTYFNSNRGTDYQLTDPASQAAWTEAVQASIS